MTIALLLAAWTLTGLILGLIVGPMLRRADERREQHPIVLRGDLDETSMVLGRRLPPVPTRLDTRL